MKGTTSPQTISEMAALWASCGLGRGDTVLLHSSVSRLMAGLRRSGSALRLADVLESFLLALGGKGTLILPTFNFGFAHGEPFDIVNTPSHMGALTELARRDPRAVRTGHPIYSFAVIGNLAHEFHGLENFSGYGRDSPFGRLLDLDGKIAALDLADEQCMTFYHFVEEDENVPYRYHKTFRGRYIDENGKVSMRDFGLFVRDIDAGVETDVSAMGERLWNLGVCVGSRPGEGTGLRTLRATEVAHHTRAVIRSGQALGTLYTTRLTTTRSEQRQGTSS